MPETEVRWGYSFPEDGIRRDEFGENCTLKYCLASRLNFKIKPKYVCFPQSGFLQNLEISELILLGKNIKRLNVRYENNKTAHPRNSALTDVRGI